MRSVRSAIAVDRVSRPEDPVYSLRRFFVEDGVPRIRFE